MVYHDASPLVLFFWTGGACAAGLKGLRMLGDSFLGIFGIDILWSVNLPSDGPAGIEFGSVNTRVITANTAIVPRRTAIRRGGRGRTGLPNGAADWESIKSASREVGSRSIAVEMSDIRGSLTGFW